MLSHRLFEVRTFTESAEKIRFINSQYALTKKVVQIALRDFRAAVNNLQQNPVNEDQLINMDFYEVCLKKADDIKKTIKSFLRMHSSLLGKPIYRPSFNEFSFENSRYIDINDVVDHTLTFLKEILEQGKNLTPTSGEQAYFFIVLMHRVTQNALSDFHNTIEDAKICLNLKRQNITYNMGGDPYEICQDKADKIRALTLFIREKLVEFKNIFKNDPVQKQKFEDDLNCSFYNFHYLYNECHMGGSMEDALKSLKIESVTGHTYNTHRKFFLSEIRNTFYRNNSQSSQVSNVSQRSSSYEEEIAPVLRFWGL
ncbi:MAG: hypothetical protein P4M12_04875 [Gammaproteobacteria bacterium]|nr:hypothetical protein [Gammaproteobacteria bacterium]